MDVIIYLLPLAIGLAASFLVLFGVALKKGQFEDLDTPAYRILLDDKGEYNNGDQKRN